MSKEKLVPKLRFEEFENSNGWEKVELKDFLTKSVDNRGKTPPTTIEGDHPLIEVASIGKMTPDYSKVSKFMNEEIFKSKLRGYLKENDILFSTVGSIGTVSLMDDNKKAAIAQNIVGFRAKEGHVPEYVYSMLTSNYNQRRSNRIAMGAVQPSIKVSQLVNVKYPLSIIKEEQNKIGTFFKKIDEMIQVQQSKLNKVKDIKSAYLSEMFPKEGEKYPKKRFEGFTEPWDEEYLGSLSNITTGALDANAMNPTGKYDFYTSGIQKYRIDTPAFEGPAITIAGNGATVGYMHLADGSFNAYQRTYVLTQFHAVREFLYLEIGRKLPVKIRQEARMGNIPYIVMDMLVDLTIHLPSREEQQKIAEFFTNLDNQISTEEEKLMKLEKLKQAYLNDMFV